MKNPLKAGMIKIFTGFLVLFIFYGFAFSVTLNWGSVTEPDVQGYLIYYGTEQGNYTDVIDVGDVSEYDVIDIEEGKTYYFAVASYDSWGNVSELSPEIKWISGQASKPTGIDEDGKIQPENFALSQNFPNPFNPMTTISYTLKRPGEVRLTVYNIYGQTVKTLVNEYSQSAGEKREVVWNGKDENGNSVTSGVYLYSLIVNGEIETKRMIFNK
ncbi:T9SS type A sorting domain-containing protein [bacterium]|nr:T9SS type A sorting domain-containing protein [bacterium]